MKVKYIVFFLWSSLCGMDKTPPKEVIINFEKSWVKSPSSSSPQKLTPPPSIDSFNSKRRKTISAPVNYYYTYSPEYTYEIQQNIKRSDIEDNLEVKPSKKGCSTGTKVFICMGMVTAGTALCSTVSTALITATVSLIVHFTS